MQKLKPAKGRKPDAGENLHPPVDIEKARIEHAQVRGERKPRRRTVVCTLLACVVGQR